MNKPDLQLESLLNESFETWKKKGRGYCVNVLSHAIDDVFKAGWRARDEVKRFHHEAEIESMKKRTEELEQELLNLGEEKDNLEEMNVDLESKLSRIEGAISQ